MTFGLFLGPLGRRHARILQGATRRLREEANHIALQVWEPERILSQSNFLDGFLFDGITREFCDLALNSGKPAINMSAWFAQSPTPRIALNHFNLGVICCQYLLNRGKREIAYIGFGNHYGSIEREHAIRERLRIDGIIPVGVLDVNGSRYEEVAFNSPEQRERISGWLQNLPRGTAIISFSDRLSAVVAELCGTLSLRIPADHSLVSADNDDTYFDLIPGGLTSVDPGSEVVGYEAMDALLRWTRSGTPCEGDRRLAAARLVPRGSTDPYYTTNDAVTSALDLIHEEAKKGLTVDTLSSRLRIHRRSLERLFQRELSCGIHETIQQRRIEEAQRLLAETDCPLEEIASASGFTDARHLCVAFRKHLRERPSFYRKAHFQ